MSMIGISCYLTGYPNMSNLETVIQKMDELGLNTLRYASRQRWLDQPGITSPDRSFHPEYVAHFLQRAAELGHPEWKIIIDPNHVHWTTNNVFNINEGSIWINSNWGTIDNPNSVIGHVIAIAEMFPNDDRVLFEVFNEYQLSINDNFWAKAQEAVNLIRSSGTSGAANFLVFNKWDQPWRKLIDTYEKIIYSYHYYFGGYTSPWTALGAEANLQGALSLGLTIVCTEVGADTRGGSNITVAEVQQLNAYLQWCADHGIGNCLWNTENIQDFATYALRGLVIPYVAPPPYYTLTMVDNPDATITPPSGTPTLVLANSMVTIRCTPHVGHYFDRFEVNRVIYSSNPASFQMTSDITVVTFITDNTRVLNIDSNIAAPVSVDGHYIGPAPLTVANLGVGIHTVSVPETVTTD